MKNYNIFALRGDTQTTDLDVCEQLGLDPKLANTPALNEAAIMTMHKENYDGFIKRGVPEEQAMKLANEKAAAVRSEIKDLLKDQ
jgi:hypothetical protein